jgi:hypothetical protein
MQAPATDISNGLRCGSAHPTPYSFRSENEIFSANELFSVNTNSSTPPRTGFHYQCSKYHMLMMIAREFLVVKGVWGNFAVLTLWQSAYPISVKAPLRKRARDLINLIFWDVFWLKESSKTWVHIVSDESVYLLKRKDRHTRDLFLMSLTTILFAVYFTLTLILSPQGRGNLEANDVRLTQTICTLHPFC